MLLSIRPSVCLSHAIAQNRALWDCGYYSTLIQSVTVTYFQSISMPAGFRRHLVGKTLKNVSSFSIAYLRFVGRLVIIFP